MATAGAVKAGAAYVQFFGDDTRLIRTMRTLEIRLKTWGNSVTQMGKSLFAAGTAASIPLALSAKIFGTFESKMARVRALTNATTSEFKMLEEEAKKLGRDTVFSASQAAEAMSFFALAGFKVDQILMATGPTLNLAAAGMIDIAQAADISAKIMAGMGISANDLQGAVDILAKAMTTANTDILQLGDAFKFVGPVAKSAGISFAEITAAIQLLSNAGIQGEMAGTTLRGMLLTLTSPSKEAADELRRLGVRVKDARGNVRPLADILGDLERALSGLGSGDRLESLGKIFDARQAAGAAELISQGAQKLRDATAALQNASGTASRIAGTQLNTLAGDAIILLSALEGLAIEIGQSFAPLLRVIIRGITMATNAIAKWVEENRGLVTIIASAVGSIVAMGAALVAIGVALKVSGFFVWLASSGFMFFGKILGFVIFGAKLLFGVLAMSVGAVWGVVTKAVIALAVAIKSALAGGFAAAFSAILSLLTPVGVLGFALLGLAAYFVYASGIIGQSIDGLRNLFGDLKTDGVEAFEAIRDALASGDIGAAMKVAGAFLSLEWQRVLTLMKELWVGFKEFFLTTWEEATSRLARFFINGIAVIDNAWTQTVDFLADGWYGWIDIITESWNSTMGFLAKSWVRLKGLFDDSIDVDAEIKAIDKGVQRDNDAAREALGDRTLARQKEREATLKKIEEDRVNSLAALEEAREAAAKARAIGNAADIAEREKALEEAKANFKAAVDAAKKKKDEKDAEKLKDPKGKGGLRLPDIGGMGDFKAAVSGTFSASAAKGIGGNRQLDMIAENTKQTATGIKKLAKKDVGIGVS